MAGPSILSNCSYEQLVERDVCSSATAEVLRSIGFTQLTKIQLKVLPRLLSKDNCYIHARTGSGKTLAFVVPTVERLRAMKFKESHGIGALIISPTRELAKQTAQLVKLVADAHGFSSLCFTSGKKNKGSFEGGAVIVVSTPGRFCNIMKSEQRNKFNLKNLKVLILDEVDKLLDGGSHTDHLRMIYPYLPTEKLQKILVSATVADDCLKLAGEILREDNFIHISTEAKSLPTTEQIKQSYISVEASDRLSMLITVLKTLRKKKVIVFFNSCQSVKFHNKILQHFELPVLYSMGQEKQNQRNSTYSKFCELKRGIFLTTGMAERGWDIPGIQWIIVYDPPHKPEDYIHRVGRTGRGEGKTGDALLFLRPEENQFIKILRQNMNVKITELEFGGELADIQNQVMTLVDQDKSIQDQAKVAYKKFIRAYQCHSLKQIFSIESLNLNEICKSFGFSKPPMYLGQLK